MVDGFRLSAQTLAVLTELLQPATEWRYGYDLSRETGLKSGTIYPILVRLTEREWLETRWEQAAENGKPRHMYRLTAAGRRSARALVQESAVGLRSLKLAYRRK
ncbi:MAG: helix-turn-helix transcriptional regulator [Candidatus Angelobacter sp.]